MNLYLFSTLNKNAEIRSLLNFRQNANVEDYMELFPLLLDFAMTQSVTNLPIKEYVLTIVLSQSQCGSALNREVLSDYLDEDMEKLYDFIFQTDWDILCKGIGLLPFPANDKKGKRNYNKDYRARMEQGVSLTSTGELKAFVLEFLNNYCNIEEARYTAFRWENGALQGIENLDTISFNDLGGIESKKATLVENTKSFLADKPANNILLVGGSGTGKSSCVKANLNYFKEQGLKMVEIAPHQLEKLPHVMEALRTKKCHYIIYIDDLSFDDADKSYIELKVALDGQLEPKPAKVLIYATSNRRRLMKESWADRANVDDIHTHDTLHEKMSLSERFGIRLYYGIFSQKEYFTIIEMMLKEYNIPFTKEIGIEAATWATTNNGRSGRTARQFANYYIAQTIN